MSRNFQKMIQRENAPSPNLYEKNGDKYPILNISTRLSKELEKEIIALGNKEEINKLSENKIKDIYRKIREYVLNNYKIDDVDKVRLPEPHNIQEAQKDLFLRRTIFVEKNKVENPFSPLEALPGLFEKHNKNINKAEDFISMYNEVPEFREWIDTMWGDAYLKKEQINHQLSDVQKKFIKNSYNQRCGKKKEEDVKNQQIFPSAHNAKLAGYDCCSLFPSGFMGHKAGTGSSLGIKSGSESGGICGYAFKEDVKPIKTLAEWKETSKYTEIFPPHDKTEIDSANACKILKEAEETEKKEGKTLTGEEIDKLKVCQQKYTSEAKQTFFSLIDNIKRTRALYKQKGKHTRKLYEEVKRRLPEHLKYFLPSFFQLEREAQIARTKTFKKNKAQIDTLKKERQKIINQLRGIKGWNTKRTTELSQKQNTLSKATDKNKERIQSNIQTIKSKLQNAETRKQQLSKDLNTKDKQIKELSTGESQKFKNTNGKDISIAVKMLNWASPYFELNRSKASFTWPVSKNRNDLLAYLQKEEEKYREAQEKKERLEEKASGTGSRAKSGTGQRVATAEKASGTGSRAKSGTGQRVATAEKAGKTAEKVGKTEERKSAERKSAEKKSAEKKANEKGYITLKSIDNGGDMFNFIKYLLETNNLIRKGEEDMVQKKHVDIIRELFDENPDSPEEEYSKRLKESIHKGGRTKKKNHSISVNKLKSYTRKIF